MTKARRAVGVVPPLLAGLSAAVAAEMSVGLLLYADEGLLPALTLILAVEVGALGLGLWTGSVSSGEPLAEQVRRRWLFSLVVFAAAAALSAGLDFLNAFAVSGLAQGLGLALLGGLPLFSIGSLLGAMGSRDNLPGLPVARVGAPSVVGSAMGFWLAGSLLIPNVAPYSLYLFCLVVLSGGALLHGWVLDRRPMMEVLEVRKGPAGGLRVEKRVSGSPRRQAVLLLEGGRLRGGEGPEGRPVRAWETVVSEVWTSWGGSPDSLLYLGGGSGTLARELSLLPFPPAVVLVERSQELVDLARAHLTPWAGWETAQVVIADPVQPFAGPPKRFGAVVVDCQALPALAGAPVIRERDWHTLAGALEPHGVLLLGGLTWREGEEGGALEDVLAGGGRWFRHVLLFRNLEGEETAGLLVGEGEPSDSFLVLSNAVQDAWPDSVGGFRRVPLSGS